MVLPLTISKHLLRTRYPPKEDDIAAAQRSFREGSLTLHSLEEEVIRLQAKCNSLSLERQAWAKFVEDHRALLSPSNKLTYDVLQEIFYHCLPTVHHTVMSIHEPPLSLGRVCRTWRQTAYSTPKLWTSIHIVATTPLPSRDRDTAWKNTISSWLSRSGVLPLSISIYMSRDIKQSLFTMPTNDQLQPYLDLIAPHAHRWRSLRLHLYKVHLVDTLQQFRSIDVPLLEHFHIEDDLLENASWLSSVRGYGPDQVSALARGHGILQASRLRFLTLPGHLARDIRVHLRWKCLTSLDLSHVDPELPEIFETLAQCQQNLVSCLIHFNHTVPNIWSPSRPNFALTMQNLRKLSIIAGPNKSGLVCEILDNLTAPSLVHFAYTRRGSAEWGVRHSVDSGGLTRSLGDFLDKLLRPLEELDLWYEPVSEKVIRDILRNTPGLKRLSLRGKFYPYKGPRAQYVPVGSPIPGAWEQYSSSTVPINDSLLSQLIPGKSGAYLTRQGLSSDDDASLAAIATSLCPKLEILSLSKVYFSHDVMLDFIHSRSVDHCKHGVARLRKLSIHFSAAYPGRSGDNEETALQRKIVKLEKATGLQMFLHYPNPLDEIPPYPFSQPYSSPSNSDLAYIGLKSIDSAPMHFCGSFDGP